MERRDETHQRIFPIRLAPSSQSHTSRKATSYSDATTEDEPSLLLEPGNESSERVELPSQQGENLSVSPPSLHRQASWITSDGGKHVLSQRYEYAVLNDGTHGVIQATRDVFTRCEDEPIHIPGAIQSYGMLVALQQEETGRFVPRVVSENSFAICRRTPKELFALDSFLDAAPAFQRLFFTTNIQAVYRKFQQTGNSEEPVVFPFSFLDTQGNVIPTLCAIHCLKNGLLICEFELQDYSMHPDATPDEERSEHASPLGKESTGNSRDHIASNDTLSETPSHPRLLDFSDLQFTSPTGDQSFQILHITSRIQRHFASASTVPQLIDRVANVVQELTGFHRSMVYQFDQSFNGEIIAEVVDVKCPSVDRFKGLHFPASDIPKQARDLYKINKVRTLFDIRQPTARLVGRSKEDIAEPLDLTHSYLRAMSPVHIKYLNNMGIVSSMSMSLQYENELWGLIVCHSYGLTAARVPFRIRELCFLVGLSASTSLENLLNAGKLQAMKIMDVLLHHTNPNECITASSDELLRLFGADCGFLVVDGQAKTIGKLVSYTESVTLLRYLFSRQPGQILFSNCIMKDLPDLKADPGFTAVAGFLYVPLSLIASDFIVFLRKDQIKQVDWAGNPNSEGKIGLLEPRASFKKWTETVRGTCNAWAPEQLNLAAMAQLVYGSFIRVWREKEVSVGKSRLKRLLLHDVSHQVRTPLNQVINYLEMALEKQLEGATKQILSMSYTASKSLVYVIDDLLNLTSTKSSRPLPLTDPFDLQAALEVALSPLELVAKEKGIGLRVEEREIGAHFVRGDIQRFQRVVSNLVTNAIEHTHHGEVLVEWSNRMDDDNSWLTRIAVTDQGSGLTERELDDIFQEFEEVPDEDADETSEPISPPREDVLHLGMGLAYVARYVKCRNGQIIVTSTKGKGSTFAIELPFLTAESAAHPFQSLASFDSPRTGTPRTGTPTPVPSLQLPDLNRSTPRIGIVDNRSPGPSNLIDLTPSPAIDINLPSDPNEPGPSCPADRLTAEFTFGNLPFATPTGDLLVVLIADDNNINVHVLQKRLKKLGHQVKVSRNGRECFDIFKEYYETIDFILMDIDMPIVDGFQSTALIRGFEKEREGSDWSRVLSSYGRTPIFAISGHLRRDELKKYVDYGFDGWMPKPVDMSRIGLYLAGALDEKMRERGMYDEKYFELGGWFERP